MRIQRTAQPERGSAPWTVWTYGILQLPGFAISFVVHEIGIASRIGGILLEGAIFVGLLKGARLAWMVAMLFEGIGVLGSAGLISRIVQDENEIIPLIAIQVSLVLLNLIILLHPRTRAWTRPR